MATLNLTRKTPKILLDFSADDSCVAGSFSNVTSDLGTKPPSTRGKMSKIYWRCGLLQWTCYKFNERASMVEVSSQSALRGDKERLSLCTHNLKQSRSPIMMRIIGALIVCHVVEGAFVNPSSNSRASCSSAIMMMDRRTLLGFVASTAFLPSTAARAAEDNDELARDMPKHWPETPSPLPSMFSSAAELAAPVREAVREEIREGVEEGIEVLSDLEKALQQSAKKKQVDPRSHG